MLNTDLGGCEQFIYELRRSNLIERGQLDQVIEDFIRRNPRAEPNTLAEHLIAQNVLTRFQAERILQGKTQGLVLGPYVLSDAIGQGSMGVVHKALSKNDGKWYAVKVLPRRSMWNVRLARRQVRSFSQFTHPTVVPFVDVGTSGGLHYLVWNFVEGDTLEAVVQQRGKLDPITTAGLALQIAIGLNLAHQNTLFHGLLKPSNIMISPGPQLRMLDFGIGSLLAENEGESLVDTMSTANTLTSGLDCASPESIMEPTNRTPAGDQYSLGCTLYYCLTGRYPFAEGSAVEKMMAHQFKEPTPLAELAPDSPPELIAIVEKLMKKKPEDRYHGLDEVVEALNPMVGSRSLDALVGGPRPLPASKTPLGRSNTPLSPSRQSLSPSRTPAAGPAPPREEDYMPAPARVNVAQRTPMPPLKAPPDPGPAAAPAPTPAAPASPPRAMPSRRSFRSEAAPPPAEPVPPVARLAPANQAPAPAALPPPPPHGARPEPRPSPFQLPLEAVEITGGNRPMLGPLGFLAVGACLAVAGFLLAHNLFMK